MDLLVVMPFEGRPIAKAIEVRQTVYAGFAMDFITITPSRLQERIAMNDFFLREIIERVRRLYAADYATVD